MYFKTNKNTSFAFWAFLISIFSLVISIRSCFISERTHYLHVDPELKVVYVQTKEEDYILFRNESPIDIVSISIDYKNFGFDKEKDEYRVFMPGGNVDGIDYPGTNWVFIEKLRPHQVDKKSLGELTSGYDVSLQKFIIARVFNLTYYRATDMKKYHKRVVFFIDNGKVYNYKEAQKEIFLSKAMRSLDDYIRKYEDHTFELLEIKVTHE